MLLPKPEFGSLSEHILSLSGPNEGQTLTKQIFTLCMIYYPRLLFLSLFLYLMKNMT